ncbi:MAG: hypothetical protein KKG02_10825 [Candidatus Edwardsbacteria bacterium]|nr:hypothetical protein [Candidatus Edwardsbacteria bacterium]
MTGKGLLKNSEKKLILCFYKPMSPSELIKTSGINNNFVNCALRRLSRENIVKCFNPDMKTGRIYGLTSHGKILRKELLKSTDFKEPCHDYYIEPSGIDWKLYGWITAGKGKREYLKIMNDYSKIRDGTFKASQVFTRFRYQGIKSTPRTEVYRAIKQFIKRGILSRIAVGKRNVRFKFTKKGLLISEILSA